MQRVANCVLIVNDQVLLLQKPSKGWFSAPGGKMELGESVKEAAVREFWEETGLTLKNPSLRGVFTFVMKDNGAVTREWMMFTFAAEAYYGELLKESLEGQLMWKHRTELDQLPMAEGDRRIFAHILSSEKIVYGTFTYTEDYQLLEAKLDPQVP